MAIQLSVAARNARLDAIEVTAGASAKLRFYTGAAPGTCATAASGTLVADIACPADWMAAAASGVKSLAGSWSVAASGTGTVGHYRIVDSTGVTCHVQGTVTVAGGGGDMIVQNTSVNAGQTITVTQYDLTDANA